MTYFFTYCITNKFTLKLNYKYGDMSMNHEVKKHQNLLNEKGNLNEPGYSKVEVFNYDRKQIKVSNFKIKEWDYYFVGNRKYGLCLTIGDNGYVGSIGFTHLDFE